MAHPTPGLDEARRIHDDAILVDGQGVTVLLPVAQVVPEAINGVPYLDRAIAGGVTARNVTLGIGGIGMGTDDFNRVDHFPRLTAALIGRGFSAEETTKILGGNFMRVFDRVWKA